MTACLAAGAIGLGSEAWVRARLDAPRPATTRFYARAPVIRPAASLEVVSLQRYLSRAGYRRTEGAAGSGQFQVTGRTWTIGRRPFRSPGHVEPGGRVTIQVDGYNRVQRIEDSLGLALDSVALEPEPLRTPGDGGDDRIPVPLDHLPQHLVDAVLTIEDRRFFSHPGFDLERIAGAARANLRAGEIAQGGSTITQQLAKNLFLSMERTPLRKLRELAMAVVLEIRYSKREILEAYLNEVYLGQDGGYAIHGMGRAARFYFGKDISDVGPAEAAALAGLIHGPNLYSPFKRPDAARARRNLVLALMRDRGLLDSAEARKAATAPLGARKGAQAVRTGRYFTDYVARELARDGREIQEGVTVFTTLDMNLQIAAESAVTRGLAQIEAEHPNLRREDKPLEAALVALDPATGEVLAMVGGRDYGATQFNRVTDAHRQPGSTFKPIVALAALAGRTVTLASQLEDSALEVKTDTGTWRPANYDGQFRGPVTLRHALETSLNVPFARLGLVVGARHITETARRLGIASPLRAVPSIALGSSEVTPLELTAAFSVLAARGFRTTPHGLLGAVTADGQILAQPEWPREAVYSPAETFLVTSALEGAVNRGTGRGLRGWGYQGPVAAKSGTSNDYRDAWFVGYTPRLVLGVWVGFDDGKSLGLSGAQAALPIFARFLTSVRQAGDPGDFVPPADVEIIPVDPETGIAADRSCGGEDEFFLPGTMPVAGDGCAEDVPHWIADAGSKAVSGIKSFFGRLFGKKKKADSTKAGG